jgi:hypothetical protein
MINEQQVNGLQNWIKKELKLDVTLTQTEYRGKHYVTSAELKPTKRYWFDRFITSFVIHAQVTAIDVVYAERFTLAADLHIKYQHGDLTSGGSNGVDCDLFWDAQDSRWVTRREAVEIQENS